MDAQTRKLAGFAIAAVGAVVAFIGLFARQIGLGEGGFGPRQIIATVIGLALLAAGLLIALVLKIGEQDQPTEPRPTDASPTIAGPSGAVPSDAGPIEAEPATGDTQTSAPQEHRG